MGIYGQTKNTPLEKTIRQFASAEANGTMMYYALARIAREQGLDVVATTLTDLANQEAVHSGFYATLNARYPQDFWKFLRNLAKLETGAEGQVMAFAAQLRQAGFAEAADEVEIFAKQEGRHGVVLSDLVEKYAPKEETKTPEGKKVYVCSVCGYEYVGELGDEPDDYTCPLCGQPKSVFKEK